MTGGDIPRITSTVNNTVNNTDNNTVNEDASPRTHEGHHDEEEEDHDYPDSKQPVDDVRILVLYTGGTIGMRRSPSGYVPVKGFLAAQIAKLSQFHDPRHERSGPEDWFVGPVSPGITPVHRRKRPRFLIKEFDPLMDSSNMQVQDWVKIAEEIERNYDQFDAFICLHGTDTMAFTCSALSFMLQHLGKTVILTGSQIPISRTRNDGFDNLLGSLTVAMHYEIPEVTLFFDKCLFRGNRVSKVDATGLHAFDSEKYPQLVKLGIEIEVNWSLIRRSPLPSQKFRMRPIDCDLKVGCLRLFPGMSDQLIENFLKPPMEGIILLTYGAGNAPDNRPEFLKLLREASNRGVVIINVTQCNKGRVVLSYQTGVKLVEAGVISGNDMTTEASLTKLMWLLSLGISRKEVKRLMQTDLRGELTLVRYKDAKVSLQERDFLNALAGHFMGNQTQDEVSAVEQVMYPVLLCSFAAIGELDDIRHLIETNGCDPNVCNYDKRTALHVSSAEGHAPVVQYLVENGATVNAKDRLGCTSLDEALQNKHDEIAEFLRSNGALTGEELLASTLAKSTIGDSKCSKCNDG